MNFRSIIQRKKDRRARRVRSKVRGTAERPRLAVFRSNKETYIQLIDDTAGKTVVSASTNDVSDEKLSKKEAAWKAGELAGKRAVDAGIAVAVFDRRSYQYHGRVAAVADGARQAGLKL